MISNIDVHFERNEVIQKVNNKDGDQAHVVEKIWIEMPILKRLPLFLPQNVKTMNFSWKEILSVSLILFSVIDIVGNIPIVIELRKKAGHIYSGKATIVSGIIMFMFLFIGEQILNLFGIDHASFAIVGSIIIFLIGAEMVLGITIFRESPDEEHNAASIVPLAFPLIAGAGTMTTLITLRAEFDLLNISIGIIVNLLLVYLVLKSSAYIEKKLGKAGQNIMRKVFGIILLSIAVKLFKTSIGF